MQIIFIASYKEDGQPCCASLKREGLQKSLDKYNGFDGVNPNISILDRKIHEYKYGGESLIETITYRDLTYQDKYSEDIDTVYYIHCLDLD
jgi:hypothetical protein